MPIVIFASAAPPDRTTVAGVLVFLVLAYLVSCWWWPYAACPRCKGAARFRSGLGAWWRNCPRCGGSGHKVRFGARVLERMRRREE
ncbi:MAG: hypothetical protein ACRD0V_09145 [Acidimicrobiales bacterium]